MTELFGKKISEQLGKKWKIEKDSDISFLVDKKEDVSKIQLRHFLKEAESRITGEEKLKRHNGSYQFCLDIKDCEHLYMNQALIPKRWKERIDGNATFVFFDKTLISSKKVWYILGLCWNNYLEQHSLCYHSLGTHLTKNCLSALILP